jgi:class 3 adenylate cyclase
VEISVLFADVRGSTALAERMPPAEKTGNDGPKPWIPVGVGVRTGRSFVGTVGEGDASDFTALGDTVNTTARLTGLAAASEILVSAERRPQGISRHRRSNGARWSYADASRASTLGL